MEITQREPRSISAGYSKNTAHTIGQENLTKPEIAEEINRAINQHLHNCGVTYEWCVSMLKQMAEKCISGDTLKDGAPNPSALVSAIQELNRMMGNHAPDKVINANVAMDARDMVTVRKMIKEYSKDY